MIAKRYQGGEKVPEDPGVDAVDFLLYQVRDAVPAWG